MGAAHVAVADGRLKAATLAALAWGDVRAVELHSEGDAPVRRASGKGLLLGVNPVTRIDARALDKALACVALEVEPDGEGEAPASIEADWALLALMDARFPGEPLALFCAGSILESAWTRDEAGRWALALRAGGPMRKGWALPKGRSGEARTWRGWEEWNEDYSAKPGPGRRARLALEGPDGRPFGPIEALEAWETLREKALRCSRGR